MIIELQEEGEKALVGGREFPLRLGIFGEIGAINYRKMITSNVKSRKPQVDGIKSAASRWERSLIDEKSLSLLIAAPFTVNNRHVLPPKSRNNCTPSGPNQKDFTV